MRKTLLMMAALLGLATAVVTPANASERYLSGYSSGSSKSYGFKNYGGGRSYGNSSNSYRGGRTMSGYNRGSGSSGRYLSGYGGGSKSYHGGKNYHYSQPKPQAQQSSERRYTYRTRATGGNYRFTFFRHGADSRTGYNGASTPINNPHRRDWEAYLLRKQRQANQETSNNRNLCGNYNRAPAACRTTTTRYDPVRYVEVRYIPEVAGAYR